MLPVTESQLRKIKLFEHVKEETLKELAKHGEVKRENVGSHIFRDKELVNTVYIVISGSVSLYKMNARGQKRVIFILGEGKLINEVILQELPASVNCEIFEEAQILCYSKYKFLEIMEKDFELTKVVINSLSTKVRRMYRQLKNATAIIKMEKRVAAKLWKLGKDYGVTQRNGVLIDMPMSVTYLADLLGAQRETISRALKILVNENLIEYKNKKIFIKNEEALINFFKAS